MGGLPQARPTPNPSSFTEDTHASGGVPRRQALDGRPPKGVFEPTVLKEAYGYPSRVVPVALFVPQSLLAKEPQTKRGSVHPSHGQVYTLPSRTPLPQPMQLMVLLDLIRPLPLPRSPYLASVLPLPLQVRRTSSQEELCTTQPWPSCNIILPRPRPTHLQ